MPLARTFAIGLLAAVGAAVSGPGNLTLSLGSETTEFEVTHCRVDPYPFGPVVSEAEVTAVGSFRGQPAALLIWKVSGDPESISLYLTELSAERRTMPPNDVVRLINEDYETVALEGTTAISADYTSEKLNELPEEEQMAKLEEMMARMEVHTAKMKELRVPWALSSGTITVDGSKIGFVGNEMRLVNGEPGEAFADLGGAVRVSATCDP